MLFSYLLPTMTSLRHLKHEFKPALTDEFNS